MKFRIHFTLHFERDFEKFEHVVSRLDPQLVEALPYLDHGAWDRLKRGGDDFVARWFDRQLESAHLVVVLIGAQTYARGLVRYELSRAARRQRAMFGVNLCGIPNRDGAIDKIKGANPFDYIPANNTKGRPDVYTVHDWSEDRGPSSFHAWVLHALRH